MKRLLVVFFVVAFILLSGWSIMFYSIVYRWYVLPLSFPALFGGPRDEQIDGNRYYLGLSSNGHFWAVSLWQPSS